MMVSNTTSTNITITHSAFGTNGARCGNGGGFYNTGPAVVSMSDNEFLYNHAMSGAAYYDSADTILTMENTEICTNNIDAGGSGAAGMELFGDATLTMVDVCQNTADAGPGGIKLNSGSSAIITDSRIHNNTGNNGGGILATANTSALLQRDEIARNEAIEDGGGILLSSSANMNLENVTVAENWAEDGGGIYLYDNSTANLNHVTVAENFVTGDGMEVYVDYNGHWSAYNSIISWSGTGGNECYYVVAYGGVGSNIHNITTADTQDVCKLSGLFNTDPMLGTFIAFYGPNTRSLALLPGSPAIDAAINSDPITTDQYGRMRVDGDDDGTITSDVGAVEFYDRWFLPFMIGP